MAYTSVSHLLVPFYHNGDVLNGGTATFYRAGTSTEYPVFVDSQGNGGASTRSFESDGTLVAFSDGDYDLKIVIKDAEGATIATQDNIFYDRSTGADIAGKLSRDGSDQMTGALDMGTNDIVSSGNITLGANKSLVVQHSGNPVVNPLDGLVVSEADGYVSIRGGANFKVYDNGVLAQTIDSSMTTIPTALTVNGVNVGTTLTSLQGQITANDGDISTINSDINTLESDVNTALTTKVTKAGDTMSGVLAMGGNKITGLGNATVGTDALNMDTADGRYVNLSGDIMTGNLNLGNNLITNADSIALRYVYINEGTNQYLRWLPYDNGGVLTIANNTNNGVPSWSTKLTLSNAGVLGVNSVGLSTGATVNEFSTDGTMGGNSNSAVPTEAATKSFVETSVANVNLTSKVSKSGDTMSGNLNMGLNNIQDVGVVDTVGLELTNGSSTVFYLNDEAGTFEISNSGTTRVLGVTDAGRLSVGSGTEGLPSFTFINDTNTGIFNSSADTLDVSTGGVRRAIFNSNGLSLASGTSVNEFSTDTTLGGNSNSAVATEAATKAYIDNTIAFLDVSSKAPKASPVFTGVVSVPQGSVSAPSLTFTGDPNTGIYSNGPDGISFTTGGGGGKMSLDANGLSLYDGAAVKRFSGDTTMSGDNTYVPTMYAVRTFVENNAGSGSMSYVVTDEDYSSSSTSNTFAVTATGIGTSTKAARVVLELVVNDAGNFTSYRLTLVRAKNSSTWSFAGIAVPCYVSSLSGSLVGSDRGVGTATLSITTLLDTFNIYSSTNYSADVSAVVATDSITFTMARASGTPQAWTSMNCIATAEVF
jgi:hypothetical protein